MEGAEAEPEVCLGVKMASSNTATTMPELENDSEIDSFLSSNGFEYVDATRLEAETLSQDGYAEGMGCSQTEAVAVQI
jgi:hypothetical protein